MFPVGCLPLLIPSPGGPDCGDLVAVVVLVPLNACFWGYVLATFIRFGKRREAVAQEKDNEQEPMEPPIANS